DRGHVEHPGRHGSVAHQSRARDSQAQAHAVAAKGRSHMNCRQARALFGPYWDDELTQAEREWLEAHFGSCAGGRRDYEELARSLEWMSELPRAEVTPGFADRVLAQARRRTPATDRVPGATPRWIPVTAAAALLAVLGGMVLQWGTGVQLAHHPAATTLDQPVAIQPKPVHGTPAGPPAGLGAAPPARPPNPRARHQAAELTH